MFFVRRRYLSIPSAVALVAALTLIATEVFASSNGITNVVESVIIPN